MRKEVKFSKPELNVPFSPLSTLYFIDGRNLGDDGTVKAARAIHKEVASSGFMDLYSLKPVRFFGLSYLNKGVLLATDPERPLDTQFRFEFEVSQGRSQPVFIACPYELEKQEFLKPILESEFGFNFPEFSIPERKRLMESKARFALLAASTMSDFTQQRIYERFIEVLSGPDCDDIVAYNSLEDASDMIFSASAQYVANEEIRAVEQVTRAFPFAPVNFRPA